MGIRDSADLMHLALAPDPILLLQVLASVFIVLTLPGNDSKPERLQPKASEPEPFLLGDGVSYVEHAGMTIEHELYELISPSN
jgi:hypothetical protein